MFSLAGKACVVTDASRGLGRAIAIAFAEQGAGVLLAARSRADLETVRDEITRAEGVRPCSEKIPIPTVPLVGGVELARLLMAFATFEFHVLCDEFAYVQ